MPPRPSGGEAAGSRARLPAACKACCIEDFGDPELLRAIREVFPHEIERRGPAFPRAGSTAPTIFWLTRRVGRVFATDPYLDPGVWGEFADASMLTDPGRHWPFAWNPRRLVTQHMDALDLHYEDES